MNLPNSWGHGKPFDLPWNTTFNFSPAIPIKLPPGVQNLLTPLPHPDFIVVAVFRAPREATFTFSLTASMVQLKEPTVTLLPSVPSPYVQVIFFLKTVTS